MGNGSNMVFVTYAIWDGDLVDKKDDMYKMAALLGRRDFRGVLFVYFLWIFRCSFSVPRWSRL